MAVSELRILIVPKNPLGMSEQDLQPLMEELGEEGKVEFRASEQRGYGVTWWEVLTIYLLTQGADALTGNIFETIIETTKNKAIDWYRGRRASKDTKRPFLLEIRGEDGALLKAYKMDAEGKLEETTGVPTYPPPPAPESDGAVESSPNSDGH